MVPESGPESRSEPGPGPGHDVPPHNTRVLPSWLRFVVLGSALIVASSAALCTHRVLNIPDPELPPLRTTTEELRATPAVVTALRELSRLESAQARVERVIDLRDRQESIFGLIEASDAILLVAAGDVVAGVDLSELGEGDVSVSEDRREAEVRLPRAAVLSARLDNDATYVHTRTTELLARRSETLETRARQAAERELEAAAVEAGLLTRADANAERTVASLLRALGFERVSVEFRDAR